MQRYFILFLNIWLISTSEPTDEEVQVKNRSPLLLTFHKGFYHFPVKARITTDQTQEFYFIKKQDTRFFCPIETEIVEENSTQEVERGQEQEHELEDHEHELEDQEQDELEEQEQEPKVKAQKDLKLKYQNCLFEKKFKKKEKNICNREVKPMIVPRTTLDGGVPCGQTGYWYQVAFKVCVKKSAINKAFGRMSFKKTPGQDVNQEIFYLLTYEVCYDHFKTRVLFTSHKIISPHILRNVNLEQENALHEFPREYSTDPYGLEELENLPNILDAVENQKNSDDEQVLLMLVPIEDFALGHWIKTTFHIMNSGVIHKSKAPIWRAVNAHVTDRLIKIFHKIGEVEIFTGTSGEQHNGKKLLYLGNDKDARITIPKIWWKLLYSRNHKKGIVVIMHNVDDLPKICLEEKTACDVTRWKTSQLKSKHFKDVYCCTMSSASTSIKRLNNISEIDLSHDLLELDEIE